MRTQRVQIEPHILIVDDDLQIRKLLGRYLADQGFRVTLASDKRTLEAALESNDIKLIVLDVMLPDGSGLDICRDMRTDNSLIPIILLTALKEDVDRIIGLEIGADDYLGKPFNPRELAARIRAVLRRQKDAGRIRSPACTGREVRTNALARIPARRDQPRRWRRVRSVRRCAAQPDSAKARRRRISDDRDRTKWRLRVYCPCLEDWARHMTSLRARIAATLVLSIICVVGISTATLFWARAGHEQKEQEEYVRLVSEGILLIAPFLRNDGMDRSAHLRSSPAAGEPRPELTSLMQSQLRSTGSDLEIVVTQPAETPHPVASVKFQSGWLAIPVRDRHPKGGILVALAGWIGLVTGGTVG